MPHTLGMHNDNETTAHGGRTTVPPTRESVRAALASVDNILASARAAWGSVGLTSSSFSASCSDCSRQVGGPLHVRSGLFGDRPAPMRMSRDDSDRGAMSPSHTPRQGSDDRYGTVCGTRDEHDSHAFGATGVHEDRRKFSRRPRSFCALCTLSKRRFRERVSCGHVRRTVESPWKEVEELARDQELTLLQALRAAPGGRWRLA